MLAAAAPRSCRRTGRDNGRTSCSSRPMTSVRRPERLRPVELSDAKPGSPRPRGIRFTQYSGSTVCAPSRAALMTGFHSGHGWIRGNGEFPLRDEDVTVAMALRDAGYRAAVIGKWGLGRSGTAGSPIGRDSVFLSRVSRSPPRASPVPGSPVSRCARVPPTSAIMSTISSRKKRRHSSSAPMHVHSSFISTTPCPRRAARAGRLRRTVQRTILGDGFHERTGGRAPTGPDDTSLGYRSCPLQGRRLPPW